MERFLRYFPMTILIIDDEPTILAMLEELLANRGYVVQTAASAQEATKKIERFTFDLILTDMRMETPTAGYDVVRAAKATSYNPVVAILTAFPLPSMDWRSAGADALFMKGDNVDTMIGHLQRLLRTKRA